MTEDEIRSAPDHVLNTAYWKDDDQDAFRELHRRHGRVVRSFARKCAGLFRDAGETADKVRLDDLCQEIWAVVAQRAEDFDPTRNYRSWVLGIARNMALMEVRSFSRRPDSAAEAHPRDPRDRKREPNPARIGALRADLSSAMEVLDSLQREAIHLKFWDGMTAGAIARTLGISESTIARNLRDAMKKLRPLMGGWGRIVRKKK
jgi:RNA polymerase sigma factor (sigma-70 family)